MTRSRIINVLRMTEHSIKIFREVRDLKFTVKIKAAATAGIIIGRSRNVSLII